MAYFDLKAVEGYLLCSSVLHGLVLQSVTNKSKKMSEESQTNDSTIYFL